MKMVFKKLTYSIKGSPTNEKMKKKKSTIMVWLHSKERN